MGVFHLLHVSHEDDQSNRSPNPKPFLASCPAVCFSFVGFGSARKSDAREREVRRVGVLQCKAEGWRTSCRFFAPSSKAMNSGGRKAAVGKEGGQHVVFFSAYFVLL